MSLRIAEEVNGFTMDQLKDRALVIKSSILKEKSKLDCYDKGYADLETQKKIRFLKRFIEGQNVRLLIVIKEINRRDKESKALLHHLQVIDGAKRKERNIAEHAKRLELRNSMFMSVAKRRVDQETLSKILLECREQDQELFKIA